MSRFISMGGSSLSLSAKNTFLAGSLSIPPAVVSARPEPQSFILPLPKPPSRCDPISSRSSPTTRFSITVHPPRRIVILSAAKNLFRCSNRRFFTPPRSVHDHNRGGAQLLRFSQQITITLLLVFLFAAISFIAEAVSFAEESLSLQRSRLRASAKLSPKARELRAYHQRRDLASAWLVDPGSSPETRIYRPGTKRCWIRNSDGLKIETDVCVFDTLTEAARAGRFRREELGLGNDERVRRTYRRSLGAKVWLKKDRPRSLILFFAHGKVAVCLRAYHPQKLDAKAALDIARLVARKQS